MVAKPITNIAVTHEAAMGSMTRNLIHLCFERIKLMSHLPQGFVRVDGGPIAIFINQAWVCDKSICQGIWFCLVLE